MSDWRVAGMALQIIAEQGPGLAFYQQEAHENAALAGSVKVLREN